MSVWMCPGQGAQRPKMGSDLLSVREVRDVFDEMSEILKHDLLYLACEGSEDEINGAEEAQALTMAVSVGVGRALQTCGINPTAIVGFSLGQISALPLCGALSLHDAASLLKVRSSAMAQACKKVPGGMVALLGATEEEAQQLCDKASSGEVLVCANFNAPGQIVISGAEGAISRAQEIWAESKKKSVRLATAGAFHSELMAEAACEVEEFAKSLTFNTPKFPLICNTDAMPFDIDEAPERLGLQVRSGVRFEQSVRNLIGEGETDFVEVGYGKVLTGLVRKISRDTTRANVGTLEQLNNYAEENA